MTKVRAILLGLLVGLLAGVVGTCAWMRLTSTPSLVRELAKRGVTHENITRLEIEGDESSYSAGKRVSIADRKDIDFIWDHCIQAAPPYGRWAASGYRRLNFYVSDSARQPTTTLCVNETDRSGLKDSKYGYLCNGLHAIVMTYLKGEAH